MNVRAVRAKASLTAAAECKPVSTESPPISGAVSLNLAALWFSIFIFFLSFWLTSTHTHINTYMYKAKYVVECTRAQTGVVLVFCCSLPAFILYAICLYTLPLYPSSTSCAAKARVESSLQLWVAASLPGWLPLAGGAYKIRAMLPAWLTLLCAF